MEKMSLVKKLILTALCMALCVVLPMTLHAVPMAGMRFLPMHIPVFICGLICGWKFGLFAGITGPLLSSFLTGMPPHAIVLPMMVELAIYGSTAGLIMQFVRTKRIYLDLYISLIVAMIIGRIFAGISGALIFTTVDSLNVWITSYFITALPGIIIQILLIPSIVFALEAARLIPRRYPAEQIGQIEQVQT